MEKKTIHDGLDVDSDDMRGLENDEILKQPIDPIDIEKELMEADIESFHSEQFDF